MAAVLRKCVALPEPFLQQRRYFVTRGHPLFTENFSGICKDFRTFFLLVTGWMSSSAIVRPRMKSPSRHFCTRGLFSNLARILLKATRILATRHKYTAPPTTASMKINRHHLLTALLFVSASSIHAASYAISSSGKTEWVGVDGAAVSGAGTAGNFAVGTVTAESTFAKFQMVDTSNSQRAFDMKVTVAGFVGTFNTASNNSGLMIAQTVDSQGLADTGTLSVLSSFSSTALTEVTLRFDFYEPDTTTPMTVALELTSFDYDNNQFLRVQNSDFSLGSYGSNLTQSQTDTTTTWQAPNDSFNATYNLSTNAVALNNVVDSSFTLTMGKASGGGNSLFMFEFRDPSINLDTPLTPSNPVPEPTAALIGGLGFLCLLRRRR